MVEKSEEAPSGRWVEAITTLWSRFAPIIKKEVDGTDLQVETALAILAVESNGEGIVVLDGTTYPTIRFETHLFKRHVRDVDFDKNFRQNLRRGYKDQQYRVSPDDPWQDVHTGNQRSEYNALKVAEALSIEGAYKSMSMGMAQILGSWARRLGYGGSGSIDFPSGEMWVAFNNPQEQVKALFVFLRTGDDNNANPDGDLWSSAEDKRWNDFARQYNGPGNAEHYARVLEAAYKSAVGVLSSAGRAPVF